MEHFFSPNSGEDKKKKKEKKIFTKKGTPFSPEFKLTPTLRCTPESNYSGGCRCTPYSTQTAGGIQPNYWGDKSPHPPPPRVSAPLLAMKGY